MSGRGSTSSPSAIAISGRNALVTGAAGFVGAALARRLAREGHRVTACVRPRSDTWRLDGAEVEIVQLDVTDRGAVDRVLRRQRPDWVFHLAAHGAYSWQTDASRINSVNAGATRTLVEAAANRGVEAFVHAGSSSEYGLKDHAPGEHEPTEPNSDYGHAKAEATEHVRDVARSTGLRAITLRLYSVYGPWEEPKRLVPTLLARALRGQLPPLVSPETARDFVFVDDVCDAFMRAAVTDGQEAGAVYNVGSGVQTTISELVDVVRRLLAVDAEPEWGSMEQRRWDTPVWISDSSLIAQVLGWRASTRLDEGIRLFADWLRADPLLRARYEREAA